MDAPHLLFGCGRVKAWESAPQLIEEAVWKSQQVGCR